MGILANLLKKFRPVELDDKFFGHLTYMKMPKGRISYWEAKKVFAPTGHEIELFIDAPAPEQPPDEIQHQFLMSIESKYGEILVAVETVLRPQFEEWSRKTLSETFGDEFTMTSFSIPHAALHDAQWEMSFESKTNAQHLFTVSISGQIATGVTIDG